MGKSGTHSSFLLSISAEVIESFSYGIFSDCDASLFESHDSVLATSSITICNFSAGMCW